jgi:hypothetical protein
LPLNSAIMLPAPEFCLVEVAGEEALESVDSGGDQYKNLHNITNHCTRPYAKLSVLSKVNNGG